MVFVCILCVSMLTISPRGEQVLRRCCAWSKTWQIIRCGSKRFAQSRVHKNILHTSFSLLLSRSLSLSVPLRYSFAYKSCLQSVHKYFKIDRLTNRPTNNRSMGSVRTARAIRFNLAGRLAARILYALFACFTKYVRGEQFNAKYAQNAYTARFAFEI